VTNPIHVILLFCLFGVFILPAVLVARLAERRGRHFTVYLIASLLVTWVVPLLAVMVLPDRRRDTSLRR
jgi:hypothetical protein